VSYVVGALDLAPKWSAVSISTCDHIGPFERWGCDVVDTEWDPESWMQAMASQLQLWGPHVVLIEDIPHGLRYGRALKDQLRRQGEVVRMLRTAVPKSVVAFVTPSVWQQEAGVWRKNTKTYKEVSQAIATSLGWKAPHDYTEYHGKERTNARKQNGDRAEAFLLGWCGHQWLADVQPGSEESIADRLVSVGAILYGFE
jgi:hypothetical protein